MNGLEFAERLFALGRSCTSWITTFGIVMLTYFGRVRFKRRIPGGVVAVGLGTLLSWIIGIAPVGEHPSAASLHLPVPVIGDP